MLSSRKGVVFVLFLYAIAQHEATSQNIVIVGAGLSGISAAKTLMENGYSNIVILEAENRIGGRIHSIPYGGGFIDLGAQWCHGDGNNAIYDLSSASFTFGDTGLEDIDPLYLLSNGKRPNQAQCRKMSWLIGSILESSDQLEVFDGSVGIFFQSRWQRRTKYRAYRRVPSSLIRGFLQFAQTEMNTEYASETPNDVSAKLDALTEETTGPQYLTWKTSGFKTVFDYIKGTFDVDSKIVFNKEVTNIDYSSTSSPITITCGDGSTYTADHVIFTASLGVLKDRHQSLFTPALPSAKVKAIENIGFGTLGKVFLEFDVPFWSLDRESFVGYSFIWTDADLKSVLTTSRAWLTNINSFLIVDGFPNLLETLVGGSYIDEFEALSDAQVIEDCMWLLQKLLGKTLPTPKSMKRSNWLTNRNFLGSYSYKSMAQAANNVSPADLAATVSDLNGKPKILFAGEATDDNFNSYAHGAVESGVKAANDLTTYLDD